MNYLNKVYNGYKFIKTLGSGSFGAVYLVQKNNNYYAAKVLNETYVLEEFKSENNRISREIDILKSVNNEALIKYVDDFSIDTEFNTRDFVIIMEYFNGRSLRNAIESGMTDSEIEYIFIKILNGVEALHNTIIKDHGIIHRDLKPENILVNDKNEIKIIDYGLSKIVDFSSITSTGNFIGSPLYMAPEQIRDSKHIDERADIYSLGIILYEMVTASVPFKAETVPELILKILNEPIIPPNVYRKSISDNIREAIYKATQKEKYKRFKNIQELRQFLLDSKQDIQIKFEGNFYPWILREKKVISEFSKNNKVKALFPIHLRNWMKGLDQLICNSSINAIIDPSTQRLCYSTYASTKGLIQLPYSPSEGIIKLNQLQDLEFRKNYINKWYDYVKSYNEIIIPYHYISNTDYKIDQLEDWIKINIQLINESNDVIENSKKKYVMLSINLNHLILQSEKLLAYYSTVNCDGFIVQVSEMKNINEQTLKAYISFMKTLQEITNRPVIALKVPIVIGLALIAKGVHGFSSGLANIEFFDEQYIKDENDPYNMYAKYYFPNILSYYSYPRKDPHLFQQVYNSFGKCNCKYCKEKEWTDIVSGDYTIQLHFLEKMKDEVNKLNNIIDENEKLEYYKNRIRYAIVNYKNIANDNTSKTMIKLLNNVLKSLE